MTKEEAKNKIKAWLSQGLTPAQIARLKEFESVSYPTILKYKKELDEEIRTGIVTDVQEASVIALEIVSNELEKKKDVLAFEKAQEVTKKITALKTLDDEFQQAMKEAVRVGSELLKSDDLSIVEWSIITETLGKAYQNMFNRSVTNVQVNQFQPNGKDLELFKQSLRD